MLRTNLPDNAFLPIMVHRPREAPMVWINTYLSASDPRLREAYAKRLVGFAQSTAQDLFVCGDFNMESSEWPLSEAASVGLLHCVDELVGFDRRQGTRSSARVIDFGLVRGGIHPSSRFTDTGVADHRLVVCELSANSTKPSLRWPKRRQLEIPDDPGAAGDRFDVLWKKESVEFQAALRDHDLPHAWRLLSRTWEAGIARVPPEEVPDAGAAPNRRSGHSLRPARTRASRCWSVVSGDLSGNGDTYQDHPTTSLHSSIHRHAHALRHHVSFPWENWDASDWQCAGRGHQECGGGGATTRAYCEVSRAHDPRLRSHRHMGAQTLRT